MSDADKNEIRRLMDEWRSRTNGTWGDLAGRIGVDSSYISHVRAGRRTFSDPMRVRFYEVISEPTTLLRPNPRKQKQWLNGLDITVREQKEIGLIVRCLAERYSGEISLHLLHTLLRAQQDLEKWGITVTADIVGQILDFQEKLKDE
jgi:hypothetical protein